MNREDDVAKNANAYEMVDVLNDFIEPKNEAFENRDDDVEQTATGFGQYYDDFFTKISDS